MILGSHQSAYLPWLGYFHKIALSDVFVILDMVQFEDYSFINRNRIKGPQGSILLTVPLKKGGFMDKTIGDMEIDNSQNWKEKHWKNIYFNYKKAPYFNLYAEFLEDTYKREWKKLTDLTNYMTMYFIKQLGINIEVYKQSDIKTENKKQELIMELCKYFSADVCIFGKMGKDYVDEKYFNDNNIQLYFQDYNHPSYKQLWKDFIPNMSIIDLLFNVSPDEALETIMKGNVIREDWPFNKQKS